HRPGSGDAHGGPAPRLQDVPRVHGGDIGRDRGIRGRRVAGRLGRPRRVPAPRRRPVLRPRAVAGQALAVGRPAGPRTVAPTRLNRFRHGSARAFDERPFVWITWWTK